MASDVDICNTALSHLGSDTVIASIIPADGSVESGHCARFYPIARTEMLEPYPWRFATKRSVLAQVTNPSTVWAYAYALPSDLLKAWRVLRAGNSGRPFSVFDVAAADLMVLPEERDAAPYVIEDNVLLTNEPTATLIYSRDVTDPARFSPTFVVALSYLLAALLAGPIIKGSEGARTAREYRKMAKDLANASAVNDANNGQEAADYLADSIRARA